MINTNNIKNNCIIFIKYQNSKGLQAITGLYFVLFIARMERSRSVDILRHTKKEKIFNIDGEINY